MAKGGGTCFFPGSHVAVGKFFEQEPKRFITGDFARSFGYGAEYGQNLFEYGGNGDHIVATMKAGSVCFAHGYLVHTTTPNINPDTIRLGAKLAFRLRFEPPLCIVLFGLTSTPSILLGPIIGMFSRWHFSRMDAKRRDAPRDMWKYWNGEAVLAALRRARGEEQPAETVLEANVAVANGGWRYFEGSSVSPRLSPRL